MKSPVSQLAKTLRCARLALFLGSVGASLSAGAAQLPESQAAAPTVGTPQVVRDLHWGEVLFYFYQDDYLGALTRLDAAQSLNRTSHHPIEAELLKGGLYLSLGQHEEAG